MFSRDVAPIDEWNFYGTQPFFMCVEDDLAFGVYFHNSNAQEAVFSPKPAFTWRSVGGIFDVTVMVADTPEELVSIYTGQVIGRPFLPPRWSLGFQVQQILLTTLNLYLDHYFLCHRIRREASRFGSL